MMEVESAHTTIITAEYALPTGLSHKLSLEISASSRHPLNLTSVTNALALSIPTYTFSPVSRTWSQFFHYS